MKETPRRHVMIVLGKNLDPWVKPDDIKKDRFQLSQDCKMNGIAAVQRYREDPSLTFVIPTGQTVVGWDKWGRPIKPENVALKEYMQKKVPIPDEAFITETEKNSIDSAGDAEEVTKILRAHPELTPIGLVSLGFYKHAQNVVDLLRNFGGPKLKPVKADELVRFRSEHHRKWIDEVWKKKSRTRKMIWFERIRWFALKTVDPRGVLIRKVTSKERGH